MHRSRRWTPALGGLVLTIALVAACASAGSKRAEPVRTHGQIGPAQSSDVTSPSWLNVGQDIKTARATNPAMSSFGPYLALPFDVSGDGSYDVLAGPVSAADAALPLTTSHAINWPPDFTFRPVQDPVRTHYVDRPDGTYLDIPVVITGTNGGSYVGLRVWVQ